MKYDIDEEFNRWYNEIESYSHRSERALFETGADSKALGQWLKAAFIEGARSALTDAASLMLEYGTHCAGVEQKVTRTEMYDSMADSMSDVYRELLTEPNKSQYEFYKSRLSELARFHSLEDEAMESYEEAVAAGDSPYRAYTFAVREWDL